MSQQCSKYRMAQSRVTYPRRSLPPMPGQRTRSGRSPYGSHVESILRLALACLLVLMLQHVLNQAYNAVLNGLPFR